MVKKKHNKDKKLHNSDEKLHNSNELDLSWQETVDLQPEDELGGGSEIYYSVDEDGNVHSREFLTEELIEDSKDLEESLEGKSRPEKVRRLKSSTTDIVNLVRTQEEIPKEIVLPVPKPGARPLDIRISSEVTHDLPVKEEVWQPSEAISLDKQVIVHLHNGAGADEPAHLGHDSTAASPTFSFTRPVLDQYVTYRNEGLAKKSKDWINRASQAL